MATTRYADGYLASLAGSTPDNSDVTAPFSYVTGGSLALAINDLLYLAKVPKGACIIDWAIWVPDLDSATALTVDLGMLSTNSATVGFVGATAATSNAAIFLAASTIGQAGGLVTAFNNPNGIVAGCVPTTGLLADDVFVFKAHAAATGAGTGGTLKGYIRYLCHTTGVW